MAVITLLEAINQALDQKMADMKEIVHELGQKDPIAAQQEEKKIDLLLEAPDESNLNSLRIQA